jgi:hypothetical protein
MAVVGFGAARIVTRYRMQVAEAAVL